MKNNHHGQAKILTDEEIALLFTTGLTTEKSRTLFSVCLYTGCRISEACQLRLRHVYDSKSEVLGVITFEKGTTKGKARTRTIPTNSELRRVLEEYLPFAINQTRKHKNDYLFPGRHGYEHIATGSADRILRTACEKIDLEGVSTHSFRRTALTRMSNAGVPLRHIQRISGHSSLRELERYLEVTESDAEKAIAALSFY